MTHNATLEVRSELPTVAVQVVDDGVILGGTAQRDPRTRWLLGGAALLAVLLILIVPLLRGLALFALGFVAVSALFAWRTLLSDLRQLWGSIQQRRTFGTATLHLPHWPLHAGDALVARLHWPQHQSTLVVPSAVWLRCTSITTSQSLKQIDTLDVTQTILFEQALHPIERAAAPSPVWSCDLALPANAPPSMITPGREVRWTFEWSMNASGTREPLRAVFTLLVVAAGGRGATE